MTRCAPCAPNGPNHLGCCVLQTIDNIETQKLKPLIMKGLSEADGAPACLAQIMELTFVNAIGAPSLAVLVPVITRGLRASGNS